ncbi:DUF4406 domain-containing protein [Candidatus Kaiserbacteria bacterium]|nr:DUF4406 domain-containing protein [Candidatus Kaiserbacteria bacterium]
MSLTQFHWNTEDQKALDRAQSYGDLLLIAKDVISRMRKPVVQVCGPISTGGTGVMSENIDRLKKKIDALERQDVEIFNQIPFQYRIQAIAAARGVKDYEHELLNEFYLPIFESGLVQELYFMPDWQTSEGSRWEHAQGERLGMKITYLE